MHTICHYYIIPSDNRELQLRNKIITLGIYYIIPSDNRELQQTDGTTVVNMYYIIPSDNRELQPDQEKVFQMVIISYQVITGNYNKR